MDDPGPSSLTEPMRLTTKPLSRHRSKDPSELDLMPFIGLFALLICALLVSALWESLSSLNLISSAKETQEILGEAPRRLRLTPLTIESLGQGATILKVVSYSELTQNIPELVGRSSSEPIVILFEDEVEYRQLIEVLDALHRHGFHQLQLGES